MNDLDRLEIYLQGCTDLEVAERHEELEVWLGAQPIVDRPTFDRCKVILAAHQRELLARMPREAALELLNAARLGFAA